MNPTFLDREVQSLDGEDPKAGFQGREGAIFLEEVKNVNDNAGVRREPKIQKQYQLKQGS